MHSPIRETGMHQFSVRIHSEITVPMQVQVNGEIGDLPIKKESEGLKTEQNDSEKENVNFQADQNNLEQEPETLQTEQNNVEKDLEKKKL